MREWVLDGWHDSHTGAPSDGSARAGGAGRYVVRGGSFSDGAAELRLSARVAMAGSDADTRTGFRILRELR